MQLKYTHIFDNVAHASLRLILLSECNKIFIFLWLPCPIMLTGIRE